MNAIEQVAQTIEQITRKTDPAEWRRAANRRYYERNRKGFYIRRRLQDLRAVAQLLGIAA